MPWRTLAGILGVAVFLGALASPRWRALGYLPAHVAVDVGDRVRVGDRLPPQLRVRLRGPVPTGAGAPWHALGRDGHLDLRPDRTGRYFVTVGAFGVPLRTVAVDAVRPVRVVPGGQSIAIRVRTSGLLVVGRDGPRLPWGVGSALGPGDRIVAAEDRAVVGEAALRSAVERAGRRGSALHLAVVRDGRVEALAVRPRFDPVQGRYRLGVRVRQGLTGIGTLSFYDPSTGAYGALGHRIQDGWNGQAVPVAGGTIGSAPILGVRRGFAGRPGEKIGRVAPGAAWGVVRGSGAYGIFGRMGWRAAQPLAMPLATADQVHVGSAEMRTVVRGERVERFRIRIERIDRSAPGGRALVVRVIDPGLVARTGGIVQGMSGSPIVQDGRLAGVLTHVLVSDSTRGYGIFAAWMWSEATTAVRETDVSRDRHQATLRAG